MIFLKAALLGVVEGITEFLPISSTGHMILVDQWVKLSADKAFVDAFLVVIQLPAIFAVLLYFLKDLWPFVKDRGETMARIQLWIRIVIAFLPAAACGALLDKYIEAKLFNPITVGIALLVGGIVLIALERRPRAATIPTARDIPLGIAIGIGCIQCIAMVPGTSRSAATIIGAMLLGASRLAAAEFSFFLAIPTMFGATAYKLLKHGVGFSAEQWMVIAVGSVVSFLVAYAVIAAFMRYIRGHNFTPFGIYRIALAILVLVYFLR
ncbi:MAG: undecaprenyl-diphosphate phosphatase [Candidatus Hydrogenedentes bacterium]|nr:undecaprenyl-diphosphate phosphatase [Candidatus Hydrogenedentota bacterium]